jgi:hypothetical protein
VDFTFKHEIDIKPMIWNLVDEAKQQYPDAQFEAHVTIIDDLKLSITIYAFPGGPLQ